MTRRFLTGTLLTVLLVGASAWRAWPAAPVLAAGTEGLQVVTLAKDGRILVSFTLSNGFTDELREAIRSGLPATITYEIDLRRDGLLWFDRTIASSTVTASVRFDNLTRQHRLARTVDGRGEEPRLTEDESLVREWLTVFKQLPLFSTAQLEGNVEYYVRVRAITRPRVNWLLFWPWEQGATTGYVRFTVIQ
ncbi:MAG TPA: DUF4390 domain-containing protein [Vicinamibacterales bacterium]|jgi:hypothetical protein